MPQFDPRRAPGQHADEMRRGDGRRRAEVGAGRVGLAPGQEVGDGLDRGRHGRADGEAEVEHGALGDGRQVGHGVVGQLLVNVGVDAQHGHGRLQDGAAVRRHALDRLDGDLPAGAAAVFNHDALAVARRELDGHAAADRIGRAAGREAGDDLDVVQRGRPGRLASGAQRGATQPGGAGGLQGLATVQTVHGEGAAHGRFLVGWARDASTVPAPRGCHHWGLHKPMTHSPAVPNPKRIQVMNRFLSLRRLCSAMSGPLPRRHLATRLIMGLPCGLAAP